MKFPWQYLVFHKRKGSPIPTESWYLGFSCDYGCAWLTMLKKGFFFCSFFLITFAITGSFMPFL